MEFAKIFNTEEYGQLCALLASENEESKPEIRVFCQPDGLGVCSTALIFNDSEAGYDEQEKAFNELTEDTVIAIAKPVFEMAVKFTA